jgi:hypothetical protein
MAMSKRDKERQLIELSHIVTGIRLFNKECGKGGEGIDDCNYLYPLKKLEIIINLMFISSASNFESGCACNYRRNR